MSMIHWQRICRLSIYLVFILFSRVTFISGDVAEVCHLGLIQNAEPDLIAIVRSLVENYVKGKNTLVVIAMPMSGA